MVWELGRRDAGMGFKELGIIEGWGAGYKRARYNREKGSSVLRKRGRARYKGARGSWEG